MIPRNLSDPDYPEKFFLKEDTIFNGSFRKLYNYLPKEKSAKLMSVCKYLNDHKNVQYLIEDARKKYSTIEKIKIFFQNKIILEIFKT